MTLRSRTHGQMRVPTLSMRCSRCWRGRRLEHFLEHSSGPGARRDPESKRPPFALPTMSISPGPRRIRMLIRPTPVRVLLGASRLPHTFGSDPA